MSNNMDYDVPQQGINDSNSNNNSGEGILLILGIIFFPALIIGGIYYSLLRLFKMRLSVVAIVVGIVDIFMILLWFLSDSLNNFKLFFGSLNHVNELYPIIIPGLISIFTILGGFIGLFLVWWSIHQMKVNPHRLHIPGTWQYNFSFRRTPWELWKKKKIIQELKDGSLQSEEKAPLGILESNSGKILPVYRYQVEAERHTFITGGTGSGKTVTLMNLINNDIHSHIPVIILDMKGSPEFSAKISTWCKENDCNFYHVVNGPEKDYDIPLSPGQCFYDPLKNGSATSKADMLLGMREYDTASAVYKNNMQQLLSVLLNMFEQVEANNLQYMCPGIKWDEGGIYKIASGCNLENLQQLTSACKNLPIQDDAFSLWDQVSAKSKTGLRHALDELQGQMRTITGSSYGPWMKLSKDSRRNINLYDLSIKPGSVVLFSMDTDSEKNFSQYVSALIMSDISAVSATRRNSNISTPYNLYIDEFQIIPPESISGLLEKSRASHIAVTLALQSFEQVSASAAKGEAFLNSIIDTCSNFIIHNGMAYNSAVKVSEIIGKHKVERYRASNTSKNFFFSINWKNKREQNIQSYLEDEWIYPPERFQSLTAPTPNNNFKATAAVVSKNCVDPNFSSLSGSGGVSRDVWVIPKDEVLKQYYFGHKDEPETSDTNYNYNAPLLNVEANSLLNTNNVIDNDDVDDVEDDGNFTMTEMSDKEVEEENSRVEEDETLKLGSSIVITPSGISSGNKKDKKTAFEKNLEKYSSNNKDKDKNNNDGKSDKKNFTLPDLL